MRNGKTNQQMSSRKTIVGVKKELVHRSVQIFQSIQANLGLLALNCCPPKWWANEINHKNNDKVVCLFEVKQTSWKSELTWIRSKISYMQTFRFDQVGNKRQRRLPWCNSHRTVRQQQPMGLDGQLTVRLSGLPRRTRTDAGSLCWSTFLS